MVWGAVAVAVVVAGGWVIVKRVSNIATTEGSPVGDVHYLEHYELMLDSLSPSG